MLIYTELYVLEDSPAMASYHTQTYSRGNCIALRVSLIESFNQFGFWLCAACCSKSGTQMEVKLYIDTCFSATVAKRTASFSRHAASEAHMASLLGGLLCDMRTCIIKPLGLFLLKRLFPL